ncbi:MAG: DUF1292 domain-containing protein [Clostridiales bacterium]|jgi:uncharacterized protein YrzB (UPF0473 family)|nr:DUF1292 domain-containing protein [Clostridiales bacterium]
MNNNINEADKFEDEYDDDVEIITMRDDNGEEEDYAVIDCATDGDVNYVLLTRADDLFGEKTEVEAVIVKEIRSEGDDIVYESINDDAEFSRILALFDGSRGYELE